MTRWLIGAAALSLSVAAWGAAWSEPARTGPADFAKSLVPGYPDVVAEYVQIAGFEAAGTPRALNTAAFLRLRAAADGEEPRPANAVIVAMPDFLLESVALAVAGEPVGAQGRGPHLRRWPALPPGSVGGQRRGANLADMAGARLARRTGDPNAALDYYFGPGAVGPTRAGAERRQSSPWPEARGRQSHPLSEADLAFMADWGFSKPMPATSTR